MPLTFTDRPYNKVVTIDLEDAMFSAASTADKKKFLLATRLERKSKQKAIKLYQQIVDADAKVSVSASASASVSASVSSSSSSSASAFSSTSSISVNQHQTPPLVLLAKLYVFVNTYRNFYDYPSEIEAQAIEEKLIPRFDAIMQEFIANQSHLDRSSNFIKLQNGYLEWPALFFYNRAADYLRKVENGEGSATERAAWCDLASKYFNLSATRYNALGDKAALADIEERIAITAWTKSNLTTTSEASSNPYLLRFLPTVNNNTRLCVYSGDKKAQAAMFEHKSVDSKHYGDTSSRLPAMMRGFEQASKRHSLHVEVKTDPSLVNTSPAWYRNLEAALAHDVKSEKLGDDNDLPINEHSLDAIMAAGSLAVRADLDLYQRNLESKSVIHGLIGGRPPGHHADDITPQGFCFFNNDFAAVYRLAQLVPPNATIYFFDIDVHKGNGTETLLRKYYRLFPCNIVFIDCYNKNAFGESTAEVSVLEQKAIEPEVHGKVNIYACPFTRDELTDHNVRRVISNCISDAQTKLGEKAAFAHVTCGFDGHIDDPMRLGLLSDGFYSDICQDIANQTNAPIAIHVAGGYNNKTLTKQCARLSSTLVDRSLNAKSKPLKRYDRFSPPPELSHTPETTTLSPSPIEKAKTKSEESPAEIEPLPLIKRKKGVVA